MSMHPLLDPEKQIQARRYELEKRRWGLAGSVWSLILMLGFFFSGASERLALLFEGRLALTVLVYAAAFLAWLTVLGLPVSYFGGFAHEHRWGFSTQSLRGWLSDQAKSYGVGLVLGSPLLGLWLWVLHRFPDLWWLVAGLGSALVGVIFATLFPVVILPLFHKYTPIEDAGLTAALRDLLRREGLKSGGFFKEDMSRRTRKENAFLAGLGRTRRVVLGDNLMANMETPEIVSVVAHEVGHDKRRHLWKGIAAGTLEQVAVFALLDLVLRALFPRFLESPRWNLALLPMAALFGGLMSGLLFGPLGNALSRHFEREADRHALTRVADPRAFAAAMAGLANRNLANAYPKRWVKILFYSHPPIGERLELADRIAAGRGAPGGVGDTT